MAAWEVNMVKAVTAVYPTVGAAENVYDELVADGFEQEKLFLDRDHMQVKVMTPDSGYREVEEVLGRHGPSDLWSTQVQ